MEASPATVIQYFNGEKQNLIPLFQRPYTWDKSNWQALWDDLIFQYELGDTGTHFMGAIVSVPTRTLPVGVSKHLIIDGQQRLTTVSILLCALRDCLQDIDEQSASRIHEVYLTNRYVNPEDTLKFVPTQIDRDAYRKLALDREIPAKNCNSLISKAYHFFKNKLIKEVDSNEERISIIRVLTLLERCLQVVAINLAHDDDPYLIFESLNFKGTPLTQADLVRNYLLMRFRHSVSQEGEQERIHSKYWEPLENTLKSHLNDESHLTEFLRHYMMKDGDHIKQGSIYTAIRSKLNVIESPDSVESEIREIHRYGGFYAKFLLLAPDTDINICQRLENLQQLKVTTSYPLLLRLFDARAVGSIDDGDLEKCLKIIESFIVRRAVCGVQTNQLNTLFLQWSRNFPQENHINWLYESLSSGTGNRRFPKDPEFAEAFMNQPQYGRGSTKFILQSIEKSFAHREKIDLTLPNITIEHILPQTLNQAWKEELGLDADAIQGKWLHTFGNLTLTAYNSSLSNDEFSIKRNKLKGSHIELNRWIVEQERWTNIEIYTRAESLLSIANHIWIKPIYG